MTRPLLSAALLLAATGLSVAQLAPANSPIKIGDIKPTLEKTPEFSVSIGPQRKAVSQDWLWVEVSFVYQTRAQNAPPLDDLAVNYYILLDNASKEYPAGTLLTGTVTHTGVVSGKEVHHSVALISPQTLKRFFHGKSPTSVSSVFKAIGVTISVQGQLADEMSIGAGKGRSQWWQQFQQGPQGLVLNKDQTPFAPLFYDYFDAIKAKGAGY